MLAQCASRLNEGRGKSVSNIRTEHCPEDGEITDMESNGSWNQMEAPKMRKGIIVGLTVISDIMMATEGKEKQDSRNEKKSTTKQNIVTNKVNSQK